MKQILLRVPDQLHRRLAARAERDGRSVNALATEILDAAADADQPDRQARVRARAAALGILATPAAGLGDEPIGESEREELLASMRGIGPMADDLIADERDRL